MVVVEAIFSPKRLDELLLLFFLLFDFRVLTLSTQLDNFCQLTDVLSQFILVLWFVLEQILEDGPLQLPVTHA